MSVIKTKSDVPGTNGPFENLGTSSHSQHWTGHLWGVYVELELGRVWSPANAICHRGDLGSRRMNWGLAM